MPGYDVLTVRHFEFIPIWGYAVMLLYALRRVQCRQCGVKVEQVPWAMGKHTLTEYFSPSWTAFQADRGRDFSVIVDGVSD